MDTVFSQLSRGPVRIENGVFIADEKPVGILRPSIIEGKNAGNDMCVISGPAGMACFEPECLQDLVEGLISTEALLFGHPDNVSACAELLRNSVSSRTTAFFCSFAKNCEEVCEAIDRIRKSRVLILGCGGVGSLVAFNLAGSCVAELRLVDHDTIEESNLNRQFFWRRSDIGVRKVEVLKRELASRYPSMVVETSIEPACDVSLSALLAGVDLVVLTADEPLGVCDSYLKQGAHDGKFSLVTAGYFHSNLAVTYVPKGAPKLDPSPIKWKRNPWFIGPSFGPSNTEVAGVAAAIALKSIALPFHTTERFSTHWDAVMFPRTSPVEAI
jgi:predicted ThiF/HesA family dinucleotide-utilizing enzyme